MYWQEKLHSIKSLFGELLWYACRMVRPFFGPPRACRYTISCTEYARYMFKHFSIPYAVWHTCKRVLSCW